MGITHTYPCEQKEKRKYHIIVPVKNYLSRPATSHPTYITQFQSGAGSKTQRKRDVQVTATGQLDDFGELTGFLGCCVEVGEGKDSET